MIKKFLNKEEKRIYDLTIRPLIIYGILILIIAVAGSLLKTLTTDIITGYASGYLLFSLIQYLNVAHITFGKMLKKEDINIEDKEIQDDEN